MATTHACTDTYVYCNDINELNVEWNPYIQNYITVSLHQLYINNSNKLLRTIPT